MRILLAVLLTIISSNHLLAQDVKLPFGGSEFFRFFLHQKQVKPITRFVEAEQNPKQSMIICLGDAEWINDVITGKELANFINAGGAVLIATDQECLNNRIDTWEQRFGIVIRGEYLTAKADHCFDGIDGRPWVKPRGRALFINEDSPFRIFSDIKSEGKDAIVTDHPSEMSLVQANRPNMIVTPLAGYPVSAKTIQNNVAVKQANDHFAIAMRSENGNQGRLIVLSDHSVFVNGLMKFNVNEETGDITYPNANIRFANQLIDWLKGRDNERTNCLFVSDGMVIDQFAKQVPLNPQNIPPIPPVIPPDQLANMLLGMANPMLQDLQDRKDPNSGLERYPGRKNLLRFALGITGMMFLFYCFRRVTRSAPTISRSQYTPMAMLGYLLSKGRTNERKREDLIATGNVYDAARWRIQDRFNRIGGQPVDDEMPPILVADGSRQAANLEATISRLWLIGYGKRPIPVPVGIWDELNIDLERVLKQARKGIWCFAAKPEQTRLNSPV